MELLNLIGLAFLIVLTVIVIKVLVSMPVLTGKDAPPNAGKRLAWLVILAGILIAFGMALLHLMSKPESYQTG
jgi:hypothetical protein